MNAAPLSTRIVILGLGLALTASASLGCEPAEQGDKGKGKAADPKATSKSDEKGKAPSAKDDAKLADAKGGAKVEDAKATDPKTTNAETGAPAAGGEAKKYRRGMVPPEDMGPDELKKFAADTGDPTGGEFTLAQAFEGDAALADPAGGKLVASFDTTMGAFECELYEKDVPLTVANFVGLARGKRATYDKKTDSSIAKPYFDGNIFHRVIKGFMIQTGDASNSGRGNPGYVIADELVKSLRHDSAGVLSMANREKPNTGSTQFFITTRDTKHLDGKHAVFGKCADAKVPIAISEVKVDHRAGDRPYEQVKINTVTISRKKK